MGKVDWTDDNSVELAIQNERFNLFKYILSLGEVKEKYKDDKFLYRLVYNLFVSYPVVGIIDFVMTQLNISNEKMIEMIQFDYPNKKVKYSKKKILVEIISNNIAVLKKVHSILGDKEFINLALESDDSNINAFEQAMRSGKLSHFEYFASFEGIRAVYMNKESVKLRFRLLYHVLIGCRDNDGMTDIVLKKFDFDKAEIVKLINYSYPQDTGNEYYKYSPYKYDKHTIVGQVISENALNRLKKLLGLIGQKIFIQNVLISDDVYNRNGLEHAIVYKKFDIIQYFFSFDDIQKEYASNKEMIWMCMWYMSGRSVASYLMKTLNLNEEKLRELQKFKCTKPENKYYWNKTINDKAVNLLLNGKS